MIVVSILKKSAFAAATIGLTLLILLTDRSPSTNALPIDNGYDSNTVHSSVTNEPELFYSLPSPLLPTAEHRTTNINAAATVAKTLAEMDNWKQALLEEASRYRGLPGTASGVDTRLVSALAGGAVKSRDGQVTQSQPRSENERQGFCLYVSNDYTEQMRNMLQRLETSCRGSMSNDKANECEMARSATRQFVSVIQRIQHSVCPDLGLF